MNFKSLKFLILLFIGIISFSCNKDDDSILLKNDDVKSNQINHISVKQLFQDKGFKQSIKKIPAKTKNYSYKDGETVMEHDYGFTIERYKPANVFETDSIISYTLLITRPNQSDHSVENLVINTSKITDNISAFIIKYVSDSQITNFSNFNGERKITPIVYNPNQYQNSTTGRVYYDCITVTYFICTNPDATHSPGGPGCEALPNTTTTCGWFDTGSGGAGGNSTGGNTSGTSNGGGGGGTITSPVYTMSPLEKQRKSFSMSLSDVQRTWLDQNPQSATQIYAYLEYSDANTGELPYTSAKIQNAKNLINIRIWESTRINGNLLKPCMQSILNDIKKLQNGSVGQIIQKFAGNTPGFNWTVKDGTLASNTNAETSTQYNSTTGTVTTVFDSNKFVNASNLSVARTIIHEAVHAYVVSVVFNNLTNPSQQQLLLGPDWMNAQANYNHDFMVNNYLIPIANSLQEYGLSQGYNLPRQFYEDMAWGGLTHNQPPYPNQAPIINPLFINLIPNSSDRNRILNTLSIELTGFDLNGNQSNQNGSVSGC